MQDTLLIIACDWLFQWINELQLHRAGPDLWEVQGPRCALINPLLVFDYLIVHDHIDF
jgi:hypothetical protein